uniref:RING-type E3 ubiquitin transferase BRCA1 n=1 Tax=Oryza rufipogon TaxID=4529 RepID=A0A0E0PPV2_ORYRU
MADTGSLEKMGRELKCPICLSLLSSAVSISCNHVFCNDCLTESMKSTSSCPVCKVPFRRREMRLAPHMDNLVSIFKSMEAAAGTNVVSTQEAPVVKLADGSDCVNSGKNSKRSQKSLTRKRKVTSEMEKNTAKDATASASQPTTKPSFSTNKRIQVKPFPESETPIRAEKIMKPEEPKNNLNNDVEGKNKAVASGQPGSPSLSPFFWLREQEEQEGCTAETLSETQSLDTPLRHNAPSFSDIKDSDDEIPLNTTPNSKAAATELFDSEIFEWTQRPCSPELYSTPLKKQSKAKSKLDQIEEKGDEEDVHIGGSFDKLGNASNAAQLVNTKATKQKRKKTSPSNKNSAKLSNRAEPCIKKSDANQQGSNRRKSAALKSCQKSSSAVGRNTSGRRNKASSNSKPIHGSSDNSPESYLPKEGLDVEAPDKPLSERIQNLEKTSRRKGSARKLEMAGKTISDTTEKNSEPRSKRVRRMSDHAIAKPVEVPSGSGNETEIPQLHTLTKGSIQRKSSNARRHSKVCGEQEGKNKLENTTMTPIILHGKCQNKEAVCTAPSVRTASVKYKQAKFSEQPDCFGTENFGNLQACPARNVLLKKCEVSTLKVSCAFCQTDVITEESGEMVHYQNGKQVPAEFNGGANVVHSHKNCLEWAPDVYFEDDSAFNLTTELARSRRIKCACCGIKGAALGCFEMSCRRSFHFTCAKLIPECRWDNENFVMLCPLHRSTKLPNENSEQQKQPKRKTTLKGSSQIGSNQDCGNNWKWPSGSPQKWVLCCSSLSSSEKELVSEFAKLAGVPISATWSPNVTHVIASTDLSGACKRTLKFLMAILNGRWIVSIDWVKTCMECMEPIDEHKFEVATDVHGITDGPRLGRCRVIDRQPKLFDSMRFYLHGDYTKSYRGYLQDLVVAAGGIVLQRKPVSRDQQKLLDDSSDLLIVYSFENQDRAKSKAETKAADRRQADAQALACASGGRVVSSAWVIDSIAACNLQPL